jgi:predicted cupin superfamily sugar epimerase
MIRKPSATTAAGDAGKHGGGRREPTEPSVPEIIAGFDLSAHREGGYFRETYRADTMVSTGNGRRPTSTAILYLLTKPEPSRFHRLKSDELWFYHAGALSEMVLLKPIERPTRGRGRSSAAPAVPEHRVIGPSSPCGVVPAGWWAAARTIAGEEADWGSGRAPERRWTADRRSSHDGGWTLVSCVVTPGFEYADFELADRDALLQDYPLAKELILALT